MTVYMVLVFFFKQKTAYEMRISDWSSDVCSSDLPKTGHRNAIGDSTLDAASELSRPTSKERQAHAGVIGEALETVGVYVLERWRPPKSHCKLRGQVWPHKIGRAHV